MSVSLDGFAAHPDHEIDWLTPDEGQAARPRRPAPPHQPRAAQPDRPDRARPPRLQRHVQGLGGLGQPDGAADELAPQAGLLAQPGAVDWNNATLSQRPVEEEIPERKAEGGKDMVVFGGARIANGLIRERLVDEYRLTIHPIALGEGLPLMHGLPEPQRLELVSSTVYADGSIAQVLRPLPDR
jgi:hypothetical protein